MRSCETLKLSSSELEENELISKFIRMQSSDNSVVTILEAGCGQRWLLDLTGLDFHLTGVDLDPAALAMRTDVQKDLDVAIAGDLRSVEIEHGKFDVIFCAYVLEHVEGAEHVLKNFLRWIRPNGIIVLRIPDSNSVYGYIARITPHWFHIFYYRRILGRVNAGKPGYAPYQAIYDKSMSRLGIQKFCQNNNLTLELEIGNGYYGSGKSYMNKVIVIFMKFIYLASLGCLARDHTNLLYVIRVKSNPSN